MATTTNKDKFAVISRFEKLSKDKGFNRPPLNKYSEQWASDALIQSFGLNRIYEMMDYYFSINPNPQWKNFAFKAADINVAMLMKEQDDLLRAQQRAKMKELLDES
jgi:hypothetical protein